MRKQTPTRQELVEGGIRQWILTGRYAEGAWLPSIAQLCKHFKVSDKTVKIALTRLKQGGLLKGFNGRGLQVCRRQKQVLLLSRRRVKTDWSNMSEEEAILRAAVEGWHEKIQVLGREGDSAIGPDLNAHAAQIRAADVVVTYSIQNEDYHLALGQLGRPVLAIDFCPQRAAVNSVSHASFQAGYTAARHFLDLGHRRIAFLGVCRMVTVRLPEPHTEQVPERDTELAEAGYRQALRDHGIEVPAGYVVKDRGSPAPDKLLELVRQTPAPTAVLVWAAANNFDARGALENIGLKIPADLSLCQVVDPAHPTAASFHGTAMEYDLRPVMALGVRCLKQLIEDSTTTPQIAQVIPMLRTGDSSALCTERV